MSGINRAKAVRIGVGFVAGCAIGAGGAHLILRFGGLLSLADIVGLFVALILAGSGLFTLVIGVNAATYRQLGSGVEPGQAPDAGLLRFARQTGVVSLIAGCLVAAPPIAATLAVGPDVMLMIYVALVILIAVESWVNLRLWRDGDELVRAVVIQSAAICFWVLQGLFFLWAAAERMALVERVGSWTLLVVLMSTYLIVSAPVSIRSGLVEQ